MAVVETRSNLPLNDAADQPLVARVGEARDRFAPVNPLAAWRSVVRTHLIAVAAFSVIVNLLMLTLPMYLFQISDRVLTSRSLETLLMLSVLADRKSTRLNSSHSSISYAVFCLKKKNI